jgi:ribonuclease D
MPDAIWIDGSEELQELARTLEAQTSIGVDTEFLRERTFFPKLCLLQLRAAGRIWCIDTLRVGSLAPLMPALTRPDTDKLIHAARQDLEAVYLTARQVMGPVFDTQIGAACIGMKPQVGYAELVKSLLDVTIPKGQTRTDWSMRPLTREQLDYAADDVLYLEAIATELRARLRTLGREHWAREDCAALQDLGLYEPDPEQAWMRLKGIAQLAPAARSRAKGIAVWRERVARERDLPRGWILSDPALFAIAQANPADLGALLTVQRTTGCRCARCVEARGERCSRRHSACGGFASHARTESPRRAPGADPRRPRRRTSSESRSACAPRGAEGPCHGPARYPRTDGVAPRGGRHPAAERARGAGGLGLDGLPYIVEHRVHVGVRIHHPQ